MFYSIMFVDNPDLVIASLPFEGVARDILAALDNPERFEIVERPEPPWIVVARGRDQRPPKFALRGAPDAEVRFGYMLEEAAQFSTEVDALRFALYCDDRGLDVVRADALFESRIFEMSRRMA